MQIMEHLKRGTKTHTASGEPRGFIDFTGLKQFWVHTGTACNLSCPNCFEHAGPGDARIQAICLDEAAPLLDEAAHWGAESFGFTGGEPFMNSGFIEILEYALCLAPCLVLSNGTEPLRKYLDRLACLKNKSDLTVRISLDHHTERKHDAERGPGRFAMAIESLRLLNKKGINAAVARRAENGEDAQAEARAFARLFSQNGLPPELPLAAFPNLQNRDETPEISENCINTYHTPASCASFMCSYSRMMTKQGGKIRLYACTLVDNDPAYDFGQALTTAMKMRTLLRHKRCFACFASGVSCGG